jgi:hypothetical protein
MLYEIVFYGGDGCADTVLIVRAPDHQAALELVANPPKCLGQMLPPPDVLYEMGSDNSPHANTSNILFGPFMERQAWGYGWKRWERRVRADGSRGDEWEEKKDVM